MAKLGVRIRCIDGACCRSVCPERGPFRPRFFAGTFDDTAEAVPENVPSTRVAFVACVLARVHFLELINQCDQVAHRASESIESPDKQNVSTMEFVETSIEPGPFTNRSRSLVCEDEFFGNAILQQSIKLQIKVLAACADTGIPDQTRAVGRSEHRSTACCRSRLCL